MAKAQVEPYGPLHHSASSKKSTLFSTKIEKGFLQANLVPVKNINLSHNLEEKAFGNDLEANFTNVKVIESQSIPIPRSKRIPLNCLLGKIQ